MLSKIAAILKKDPAFYGGAGVAGLSGGAAASRLANDEMDAEKGLWGGLGIGSGLGAMLASKRMGGKGPGSILGGIGGAIGGSLLGYLTEGEGGQKYDTPYTQRDEEINQWLGDNHEAIGRDPDIAKNIFRDWSRGYK